MTSCAAQIADASNPFGASGGTLEYLKLALSAEQYHLSVLQSAGAELLATEFSLPEACFIDRTVAAATLTALETAFPLAAYIMTELEREAERAQVLPDLREPAASRRA